MKKRYLPTTYASATVALLFALATTTLLAAVPQSLPLAADGKSLQKIVIAGNASERTKEVAAELAGYLSQISGAKFEVITGDGSQGIVLGTLADFPDPQLAKPLAIRDTFDGKEAFAIRTEQNRLRLIGATDLGASHAAFRLLEHLGCRWFFPAKEWEVVPKTPTLSVSLNETDRPALLARRIWYGYGFFEHDKTRGVYGDYLAWSRHNRMAASMSIYCGHAWQGIIIKNQKSFDAHPEYLALVKGKRQGPQMCVSQPAVRQMAYQWAIDFFQRYPDRDMVSLETSDGYGHCECDACKKMGSVSDRAFGLANEVARKLQKSHPGKMVGMLAYSDHCEPPNFKLEDNVYIQSTNGFITGRYSFDELRKLWPQHSRSMGFYEYYSVWLWDWDMPASGRGSNVAYLREQIPRLIAGGATSLDCESGCNWGPHGRGYYIANKLMWNPKADVDALLADFYNKAFGPAAAPMERFYERLDAGNKPILSEHLLALALRDLQEAATLAKDRDDVQARIDHLKQYLHYVRLRWDYERAGDQEQKRDLALAAITHAYRTRYSYMNHWGAIRQWWTRDAAKKFDRPEWAFNHRSPSKPWKVESPYDHEETEMRFAEDLRRFVPQPIQEKTFSNNLVPTTLKSPAGRAPQLSRQQYQRSMRYALYSRGGEPLQVTITTGVIAWYRDRADSRWKVTDAAGKEISAGRLPLDGKEHVLTVKVPRAGLYWFDFNDFAAGWKIVVDPGRPVAIELMRDRRAIHLGHMQRIHFYVPKGTRQLHYYWQGGKHRLHTPDGNQLAEITSSGKFVSIDVPPGTDGQLWTFSYFALGHLWFFNAPNYLAASPEAMLLPKELAEMDGLVVE